MQKMCFFLPKMHFFCKKYLVYKKKLVTLQAYFELKGEK